jgi:hypothetical protein
MFLIDSGMPVRLNKREGWKEKKECSPKRGE